MPRSGVRGFSPSALSAAMRRRGAGVEDLADAIGIARQTVSRWLDGAAVPTAPLLHRAAAWLNTAVSDLAPMPEDRILMADLRVRTGLTQRSAAGQLGVEHAVIGEIERGRRTVSQSWVERLAELYELPTQTIVATWERTNTRRQQRLDSL